MFPFLAAIIPALVGAAKAVAVGAVTGVATAGAAYGTSKAIEAIAGDKVATPTSDGQTDPAPIKNPATSLEPSWKALQNDVPEHLRPPEKPAVKEATPVDLPLPSVDEHPQKASAVIGAANPVAPALLALTAVPTSGAMRV